MDQFKSRCSYLKQWFSFGFSLSTHHLPLMGKLRPVFMKTQIEVIKQELDLKLQKEFMILWRPLSQCFYMKINKAKSSFVHAALRYFCPILFSMGRLCRHTWFCVDLMAPNTPLNSPLLLWRERQQRWGQLFPRQTLQTNSTGNKAKEKKRRRVFRKQGVAFSILLKFHFQGCVNFSCWPCSPKTMT